MVPNENEFSLCTSAVLLSLRLFANFSNQSCIALTKNSLELWQNLVQIFLIHIDFLKVLSEYVNLKPPHHLFKLKNNSNDKQNFVYKFVFPLKNFVPEVFSKEML